MLRSKEKESSLPIALGLDFWSACVLWSGFFVSAFLDHLWKNHKALSATLDELKGLLVLQAVSLYPSGWLCVPSFFLFTSQCLRPVQPPPQISCPQPNKRPVLSRPYLHIYRGSVTRTAVKDKSRADSQLSWVCAWLALQRVEAEGDGHGEVRLGSGMVPCFPGHLREVRWYLTGDSSWPSLS